MLGTGRDRAGMEDDAVKCAALTALGAVLLIFGSTTEAAPISTV
jgi:hypothetical protein